MIRLVWALRAADAPAPAALSERLVHANLAGVDWSAVDADAALEGGRRLIEANVPIACLAAAVTLPAHLGSGSAWLDPARGWVMAAAELGTPQLRVAFDHAPTTRNRPSPVRFADQLGALAELAGQQGVRILIETRGEFADPADLWRVIELSAAENLSACLIRTVGTTPAATGPDPSADPSGNGPALAAYGCATDAGSAIDGRNEIGRNALSVLNLRIRHVYFSGSMPSVGAAPTSAESRNTPLVRPHQGVADVVNHLRGFGYDGCLAFEATTLEMEASAERLMRMIRPPQQKPTATRK